MENNNIHPDEMDRLLRETFLNAPDSETDPMADMMAKHAYSTNWNITPPIGKVQNFIPKKGFFQGFSLNILIITAVMAVVGAGLFFVLKDTKNVNPSKIQAVTVLENKLPVIPTADIVSNIQEPAKTATKKTSKAKPTIIHDTPPAIIPALVDSQKNTPTQTMPNEPRKKEFRPEKPRNLLYVLVPDISPQERIANEKRKKDMIRQLSVFDKKSWSYIPMGTTHINGESISLQAFYMLKYEVSNVQYRTFLYDLIISNKLHEYRRAAVYDSAWVTKSKIEVFAKEYFWNPAYDNLPVVNITAEGAQMFCYWLTIEVNKIMEYRKKPFINDVRLPHVSEWIYAAKGGNDTAAYAWGGPFYRNSRGLVLGNFQGNRSLDDDDGVEILAGVNSFFPNEWGLYNMSGNVAEMTAPYPDRTMLVKGGAWNRSSEFMKLLHEYKISLQDLPTTNVGFRPVVTYIGNSNPAEKENDNP